MVTWENYQSFVGTHLYPYFYEKNYTLADMDENIVLAYYETMLRCGRKDGKEGGLGYATIKNHMKVIKGTAKEAKIMHLKPYNFARDVQIPYKRTKRHAEVNALSEVQAAELLRLLQDEPIYPIVYITLYFGLRRGEVLGLKWNAIDFEAGSIAINHTVSRGRKTYRRDRTKTESSFGTYIMSDEIKEFFQDLLDSTKKNKKLFGDRYVESDYVFVQENGKLYTPDSLYCKFKKATRKHGMEIRFHDLRHTTGTILVDRGWSERDIAAWLRHSSLESTKIYSHITPQRQAKMANTISDIFQRNEEPVIGNSFDETRAVQTVNLVAEKQRKIESTKNEKKECEKSGGTSGGKSILFNR